MTRQSDRREREIAALLAIPWFGQKHFQAAKLRDSQCRLEGGGQVSGYRLAIHS